MILLTRLLKSNSIWSVAIRGFSILSRFLLIMVMANKLDESSLGTFGLFNVSIGLLLYFVGFEFYVFNTRRIVLAKNRPLLSNLLYNQLFVHAGFYVISLPFIFLIFYLDVIPVDFTLFFICLLILEHLNQEVGRVLLTIKRPVLSNILYFVRHGLWAYYIVIALALFKQELDLYFIFLTWLFCDLIAISFGLIVLRRLGILQIGKISSKWIKTGLLSSAPFFISTLCVKLMEYIDRYTINFFHGPSEVGIYTFYVGIASIPQVIVFTGIVSISFPSLISTYNEGKLIEFKKIGRSVLSRSFIISLLISILILVGIRPLLSYVDKVSYANNLDSLFILLLAIILQSCSHYYHYKLYVGEKDKLILTASFLSLLVVLICNLILVPIYGLYGGALSLLCGHLVGFVLKFYFSYGMFRDK